MFTGQYEEASAVWWNRVYLVLYASIFDAHGFTEQQHHQWKLCTVGRLQQLRGTANHRVAGVSGRIPVATDDHAVLLLPNCLHHQTQGNESKYLSSVKTSHGLYSNDSPNMHNMHNLHIIQQLENVTISDALPLEAARPADRSRL